MSQNKQSTCTDNDGNTVKAQKAERGALSTDEVKYSILILGASYGSLLGTKMILAGHDVTLICREATASVFNSEGSVIRTPIKGRPDGELVEIRSAALTGRAKLRASTPDEVDDPSVYDLAVLAMQEPQYGSPGVRELVGRLAASRVPAIAVTNLPLPPYLTRLPGLEVDGPIRSCFADPDLWDGFDPGLVTQCSPDPQAFRPPGEKPNVLQVRLPTNIKAARFASDEHTLMLRRLERDIEDARYPGDGGETMQVPVKLRVHDSLFVPLAKWAMLMAGNYRCIRPYPKDMLSIKDAVCGDVDASRTVYDWVVDVCIRLGGDAGDFVPFDKYARAANSLASPSSAARALKQGSSSIERVDKLVSVIASKQGKRLASIDAIVAAVDEWLSRNKATTDSKHLDKGSN